MNKLVTFSILLFIIGAFISCGNNSNKQSNDNVYLQENGKTVSFSVPEDVNYSGTSISVFQDKDEKEYFVFQGSRSNDLHFYDLSTGNYLFRTSFPLEGPNSLMYINGFYIEDPEHIYLTSHFYEGLSIGDKNGGIHSRILYKPTTDDYLVRASFVSGISNSSNYTPLILLDKYVYMVQHPSQFSGRDNTPVSIRYNRETDEFETLPFRYPPLIEDEDVINMTTPDLCFSRDFSGKDFVYSFHHDENIYILSTDHTNQRTVHIKSRYINKLIPERNVEDINTNVRRRLELPAYGSLIYDKYRDVYYRFAYPESKLDPDLNYFRSSYGRKNFSVIILDNQFNILGETLFPDFRYNSNHFFVHKDGLYICNNHGMDPDYSDDVFSFVCFSLVK